MKHEYKSIIEEIINKKGTRSGIPLIKKQLNIMNELEIEFCDERLSIQAKIYLLLNDIKVSDLICENCGVQVVKFLNFKLGFKKTCSKKCKSELSTKNFKKNNLIKYGVENPNSLDFVKNKKKETYFRKYGVESYTQTDEFKEKSKNTKKKKYGVETYNNIEKNKQTCLEKYGVDSYSKTSECKQLISQKNKENAKERIEKIKKSNKKKYGNEFANLENARKVLLKIYGCMPLQNEQILEKTRSSFKKKYNVRTPFESYDIQKCIKETNKEKYGLENYMKTIEGRNKISLNRLTKYKKMLFENRYILKDDFKGVKKNIYLFECINCGTEFFDKVEWRIPRCPKCFPSNISMIETEFREFLSDNEINFISNSKSIIPPLEIDLFIPKFNIGIEINGIYYHSEISGNKDRKYHFNKCEMMNNNGYELLQFTDTDWITKKDLVKSMLMSKFNLIKNKKYARKLKIIELNINEKNSFLDKNHYQGSDKSTFKYGLVDGKEILSVMTFIEKNNELYLSRFANKMYYTVVGAFSKLLKHMERTYNGDCSIITTHADRRISNGNVYLKNNFKKKYIQKESYEYTINHKDLYHRSNFMKEKIDKNENLFFDSSLTEWENMKKNGYDRMWDAGKIKFEKDIKK